MCGIDILQKDIPHSSSSSGVLSIKVILDDGTGFDEKRLSIYDLPEHDWIDATCTAPEKCRTCGKTNGSAEGHDYNSYGECRDCGKMDPKIGKELAKCSLSLPSLPKTLDYKDDYDGTVYHSVKITDITYKFDYDLSDDAISLKVYFSGTKTYDENGPGQSDECYVGWKIYDSNNNVIDTGTFYSPSIAEGESFVNKEESIISTYDNIKAGAFRLEILDSN